MIGITTDPALVDDPSLIVNPDQPIELTMERLICSRHGEPFRARWPRGFDVMAAGLIKEVLEELGEDPDPVEAVHHLLDARPACERVSRATLQRVYIESGIGREGTCQICHQEGLGTRFTVQTPRGRHRYRHVCFTCVIYRMSPVN